MPVSLWVVAAALSASGPSGNLVEVDCRGQFPGFAAQTQRWECLEADAAYRVRTLSAAELASRLTAGLAADRDAMACTRCPATALRTDDRAASKGSSCTPCSFSTYQRIPWLDRLALVQALGDRGDTQYAGLMKDTHQEYCAHGLFTGWVATDSPNWGIHLCSAAVQAWVKLLGVDPASDVGLRRMVDWATNPDYQNGEYLTLERSGAAQEWGLYFRPRGWTPAAIALLKPPTPDGARTMVLHAAGYEMGLPGLKAEVGEAILDALNDPSDGIRQTATVQFNEHHRVCIDAMREPLKRFLAREDLRPDARALAEQALRIGDQGCGERRSFEFSDNVYKHPDAGCARPAP